MMDNLTRRRVALIMIHTYTRIGNTINYVRFKQGKAVEIGQGVIAPGGKTYTLTIEGIDANNQTVHGVGVYDRQ
jgi:hypothetical protein